MTVLSDHKSVISVAIKSSLATRQGEPYNYGLAQDATDTTSKLLFTTCFQTKRKK